MHVDHVVAAAAQLAAEHADGAPSGHRQVRHGAVQRQPEGPAERDHVIGQGPVLRRSAAVEYTCQAVVGVVGRQKPDIVALLDQLLGQSFHMASDAARIRVRVRRHKRYTHGS